MLDTNLMLIVGAMILCSMVGGLTCAGGLLLFGMFQQKRRQKDAPKSMEDFRKFIEDKMKQQFGPGATITEIDMSGAGKKTGKETSDFSFRNADGIMETVKIVIDYDLNDDEVKAEIEADPDFKKGDKPMPGVSVATKGDGKPEEEFVFTGGSAMRMKMGGTSPDEIVKKILIQQGRMKDYS